jgi:hypothetical protein
MKCDMVSKPTGRPRGRPNLALRDDPDRYVVTYYYAWAVQPPPGMSARGIALSLGAVLPGEVVNTEENLENLTNWRGNVLFHLAPREQRRGEEGSKEPRNQSAFHPRADDLARKARKFAALPISSHDGSWFEKMTCAWMATQRGHDWTVSHAGARLCCDNIDEMPIFKRALEPIINFRFGRGPEPRFRLPDFIPHDPA